jgi:tRNA1(Val) A37 N6-methylase TrmN6
MTRGVKYCDRVFASDIHDYGGNQVHDFLTTEAIPGEFEWIITNPPFDRAGKSFATDFTLRALGLPAKANSCAFTPVRLTI